MDKQILLGISGLLMLAVVVMWVMLFKNSDIEEPKPAKKQMGNIVEPKKNKK